MPGSYSCVSAAVEEKRIKLKRKSLGMREVHFIEQSASLAVVVFAVSISGGKKGNDQIFHTGILTQKIAET